MKMKQPLVVGGLVLLGALMVTPRSLLLNLFKHVPEEALGPQPGIAGPSADQVLVERLAAFNMVVQGKTNWSDPKASPPEVKQAVLEALAPEQPARLRAAAINYVKVLPDEKQRELLLANLQDSDLTLRRTTLFLATRGRVLGPQDAPQLEHDPEEQIRGIYAAWVRAKEH